MYSPDRKSFSILPKGEIFAHIPFLRALEGHSAGVDIIHEEIDKNSACRILGAIYFCIEMPLFAEKRKPSISKTFI